MNKKQVEQKLRNYSFIKNSLRFINLFLTIVALTIGIWALSVSYENRKSLEKTKEDIRWIDTKQDNVIEMMMFKDINKK